MDALFLENRYNMVRPCRDPNSLKAAEAGAAVTAVVDLLKSIGC